MSSRGGQEWFLTWPSTRTLREQLDPLLSANSERALLTIKQKTVDVQVVEHTRHAAIQRTFHIGLDYTFATAEDATPLNPAVLDASAPPLLVAIVDLGGLFDTLSGVRDLRHMTPLQPSKQPDTPDAEPDTKYDQRDAKDTKSPGAGSIGSIGAVPVRSPRPRAPAKGGNDGRAAAAAAAGTDDGTVWRLGPQPPPILPKPASTSATAPASVAVPRSLAVRVRRRDGAAPFGPTSDAWQPVVQIHHEPKIPPTDGKITGEMGSGTEAFLELDEIESAGSMCKISMRFASDLQDDLLDLSLFGSRCQVSVFDNYLSLVAQHKTGKHGVALIYQQSQDALPPPQEPPAAPVAAAGKANKQSKNAKKSPTTPTTATPASTAATVRRYTQPYFQLVHGPRKAEGDGPRSQTTFRLRPFRVMHKLLGTSSRIEWTFAEGGALICSMYQVSAGNERRTAVIAAAPAPLPPPDPAVPEDNKMQI